jgi:hypothetical protein
MKRINSKNGIKLSKAEVNKIVAQQKKEFPGDWALQQVHIARKIISLKAKKAGMDYIRSITRR